MSHDDLACVYLYMSTLMLMYCRRSCPLIVITSHIQSSQRVLMVVGLINHPEFVDSSDHSIEEELAFFTKCVLLAPY